MSTYGSILTAPSTVQFPRIRFQRSVHTSGDEELVEFLQEEIRVEEDHLPTMPKNIQGYEMHMEGTVVRLTRQVNGENVLIKFDINNNINAPIPLDMDDDADVDAEEGEGEQNLISYPELSVSITKPSGSTLILTCTSHPMEDFDDDDDTEQFGDHHHMDAEEEEEVDDLLKITRVQVCENKGVMDEDVLNTTYVAKAEDIDGELYGMLLNALLSRGIDGSLMYELIELSTAVESRHHLAFLKLLNQFAEE